VKRARPSAGRTPTERTVPGAGRDRPALDPAAAAAVAAGPGRFQTRPGHVLPAGASCAAATRCGCCRADGAWVAFEVTGSARYAKAGFPTEAVFGPVPGPVLRLVSCGEAFDRASGHYLDNLVVTARPAR
jgi:hypothetical protein